MVNFILSPALLATRWLKKLTEVQYPDPIRTTLKGMRMNIIDDLKKSIEFKSRQAEKLNKIGQSSSAAKLYNECSFFMSKLAQLEPRYHDNWNSKSLSYRVLAEQSYDSGQIGLSELSRMNDPRSRDLSQAASVLQLESPSVSFDDISGLEFIKQRIRESIIWPSTIPEAYQHYGLTPGSNLLLYGPPGCGKTLVANAAAFESDAMFIEITPSEIRDKYVGESEKRLRDYFALARSHEKTVIFIDELDGIGGNRSDNTSRYDVSVITELLLQLQNLKDQDGSFMVIGASNRPWEIDNALRRPGRFDTLLFIPHPDQETRCQLMKHHNSNRPIDPSIDLESISAQLEGYSCADIIEVCDEAARVALREYGPSVPPRPINGSDFQSAITQVKSGTLAWYKQSIKQVAAVSDRDLFSDMIAAGEYLSEQFSID